MPFTPYHIGPHAVVGFALQKFIDVPIFITANVAVDLEPLFVLFFKPDYPLHGYFHSFLFGSFVGLAWGLIAIKFSSDFSPFIKKLHLNYSSHPIKIAVSGILGVWLHILFDSAIYQDIRPFFPYSNNPFYGFISIPGMYNFCLFSLIPALILYIYCMMLFQSRNAASSSD
ncbi:MAG: hydrolase [Candidatus Ozemobacteraceae bacterium]